jgi:hypothetical protein
MRGYLPADDLGEVEAAAEVIPGSFLRDLSGLSLRTLRFKAFPVRLQNKSSRVTLKALKKI